MSAHPRHSDSENRCRRPQVKARLTWAWTMRWEPELDFMTGATGHGLVGLARTWWKLRRGEFADDWPAFDDYDPDCDEGGQHA